MGVVVVEGFNIMGRGLTHSFPAPEPMSALLEISENHKPR